MEHKPLKLAFIGGAIDSAVGTTHKISAQMDGRWVLSSGCFSTGYDSNLRTANFWGITNLYSNWQALLSAEKNNLEAVAILTPTPSHAEIVISAIEHGYPVICEKALATSSKDARKIKSTVKKQNGYLAVTYNYTGYPMLRELQRIIQRGHLGKLNQIHIIEMPQDGFLRLDKNGNKPRPQTWRLRDDKIPTLSLDLGVHIHHTIKFLSNEKPIEVVALNNNFGLFDNIIDNTMCIARYTGDLDCQIWFGKTALGNSNGLRVRVYGSKGSAEWYQMQPDVLTTNDNQGNRKILERSSSDLEIADKLRYNRFKAGHPTGFIEAFANHYYDLADSLIEFKQKGFFTSPWVFGADVAEEGLLMLEAIVKSANSKCWQQIRQ